MTSHEFEQLFKANYERLYFHAYDFVHDEDVAKDMVSDVFVNVWQLRETIDMSRVLSYLYTSVRNRCIDQLARSKRNLPIIEEVITEMADYNDHDWENYESRVRELRRGLERLPERVRRVLHMRFFEQKTNQDVAEILDMSVDGVKKIIQRAFAQLRVSLNEKMLIFVLLLMLGSMN